MVRRMPVPEAEVELTLGTNHGDNLSIPAVTGCAPKRMSWAGTMDHIRGVICNIGFETSAFVRLQRLVLQAKGPSATMALERQKV
mmetsp:Transcript_50031/g.108684  ORF Transcript_50031/g.108684 Transcript_50031/m.108684 type:complete len:85 (-) Transcript_50031:56-310(-)